jgi:hypothetical protein
MNRSVSNLIVGLLAALASSTVHASFIGQTFDVYYAFPDIDTNYAFGTANPASFTVVDPGIETVINVEDVVTITVDFGDNYVNILFNTILITPTWNLESFNGVVFDRTGPGAIGFTSSAIDGATTMAGFDTSRVLLDSGRLALDFAGLSYQNGTVLRVNFDGRGEVPVPGTLLLVATLLALLMRSARHPGQLTR